MRFCLARASRSDDMSAQDSLQQLCYTILATTHVTNTYHQGCAEQSYLKVLCKAIAGLGPSVKTTDSVCVSMVTHMHHLQFQQ